MSSDQSWSACVRLWVTREGAVEVKRGGALLGGQQTKRAWNLRFLSRLELSDTHTLHVHLSAALYDPRGWGCVVFVFLVQAGVWRSMCGDRKVCTRTVRTGHEPLFIYASFLSPQRKSTVWVFQSRPETIAPFTKGVGAWGGGVRRITETERERGGKSAASHCPLTVPHSLPYFPQHSFTWT